MKPPAFSILILLASASFALAQEKPEPPRITEHNLYMMEELVAKGADPNKPIGFSRMRLEGETEIPDEFGSYFPLDAAVKSNQSLYVKRLLALGAKPRGNELADAAFTAPHSTAVEMAKLLLKAGVDPNETEHRSYGPALHAAAYRANLKLVELLLAQPKIEVNLRDLDDWTALMHAARRGHGEIVERLLKAGADPTLKNDDGKSAAELAQAEINERQQIIAKLQNASENAAARNLPVGKWIVKFDNGVVESCTVRKDGSAFVSEPLRSAPGKSEIEGEKIIITFTDDRIERWTPAGNRFVVEHWNPISEKDEGTPEVGIASRPKETRLSSSR